MFVPAVIVPAAATFLGWWLLGADPVHGLVAAVAVLIVACPARSAWPPRWPGRRRRPRRPGRAAGGDWLRSRRRARGARPGRRADGCGSAGARWSPRRGSPCPTTSPGSHRVVGPDADARRPGRRTDRDPPLPAPLPDHRAEPGLGVRLQRGPDPAGRRRAAQPDRRRRGRGLLLGERGGQLAAPAAFPRRPPAHPATRLSGPRHHSIPLSSPVGYHSRHRSADQPHPGAARLGLDARRRGQPAHQTEPLAEGIGAPRLGW